VKPREQVTNIDLYGRLEGHLDLKEFPEAKELEFSGKEITSLDLSNNKELELKYLSISRCPFTGNLKSLHNCTKLEVLHIQGTQIVEGLEYLPLDNLKEFWCSGKLKEELKPFNDDLKEIQTRGGNKDKDSEEKTEDSEGDPEKKLELEKLTLEERDEIGKILDMTVENNSNIVTEQVVSNNNQPPIQSSPTVQKTQNESVKPTETTKDLTGASLEVSTSDVDMLRSVAGVNAKPYIDSFITRSNKLLQEKDNIIAKLTEEKNFWKTQTQRYNTITMLSEYGFNADEYEDIYRLCEGNITPEKLEDLKAKNKYAFLLTKRGAQQQSRSETENKDRLF
ncbi:27758_t:CDS:2, partial [Racocetra persica]